MNADKGRDGYRGRRKTCLERRKKLNLHVAKEKKVDLRAGRKEQYGPRSRGILLLVDKRCMDRLHKHVLQREGTFITHELIQMFSVRPYHPHAYSLFLPHKHRHQHIKNDSFH